MKTIENNFNNSSSVSHTAAVISLSDKLVKISQFRKVIV